MAGIIAGRMTQKDIEDTVKEYLVRIGIREVNIHITQPTYPHFLGVVMDKINMGNWLAFPPYVDEFTFLIPSDKTWSMNMRFNLSGRIVGVQRNFENRDELVIILKDILHNRLDSMMERVITLEKKIDDFIESPAMVRVMDLQRRIDSILEFMKSEIPR